MRVLLDECIDEGLRHSVTGHHCQTCRYAGLTGLANGQLLAAAEQAGFEVLITVDQNMPYQQSLRGRAISLLVLQARTTNLDDLMKLIPDVLNALDVLKRGEVVRRAQVVRMESSRRSPIGSSTETYPLAGFRT